VLAAQAAPLQALQLATLSHRLPLYDAATPEVWCTTIVSWCTTTTGCLKPTLVVLHGCTRTWGWTTFTF